MNVISFVLKNWQDIVVILVLIASAIMAVQKWIRVKGPLFNAMSTKRKGCLCYKIAIKSYTKHPYIGNRC